jgi:hypothetical protein
VSDSETCIVRAARKFSDVTSQIFRCRGIQYNQPASDRFGNHDLLHWVVFLTVLAVWFTFLFLPQRERVELLTGRLSSLGMQQKEEQKELQRLQSGIAALLKNDPNAWERAARGHLGWLEPGEMTDMRAWNQNRAQAQSIQPTPPPSQPNKPVAPRPPIPALPSPPPLLPVHPQNAANNLNALPPQGLRLAVR